MCSVVDVSGKCYPMIFATHGTVYKYFQKWERLSIWKKIHDILRHQLREKLGRKEKSTVAIAQRIRAAAACGG